MTTTSREGRLVDIMSRMGSSSAQPSIPRALALLSEEPNPAADAAIVEALPTLDEHAQSAAVSILAKRGRRAGAAAVVGLFASASPYRQDQILSLIRSLSAGIRCAFESGRFDDRRSVLELIVRAEDGQHVFLLADGLRSKCPRTKDLSGKGLLRLAKALHRRRSNGLRPDEVPPSRFLEDELTEALARGVATWEIHKRMEVIGAALYLIDRLEPAIRKKLTDRHSLIARPLERVIEEASDPIVAGLIVRALALPGLQSAAGRAIEKAGDAGFIRALLANGFLLGDPRIRAGCRHISSIPWLESNVDALSTLEEREIDTAVRLFAASGVRPEAKVAVFRDWLHLNDRSGIGAMTDGIGPLPNGRGTDGRRRITHADVDVELVQRSVVWALIEDRTRAATNLLADFADRCPGHLGELAAAEVHRRGGGGDRGLSALPRSDVVSKVESAVRCAFDCYWEALGRLTPEEESALTESLRSLADHLCHDADPGVRSFAVAQLRALSSPTRQRILRRAVKSRRSVQVGVTGEASLEVVAAQTSMKSASRSKDNAQVRNVGASS